MVDTVNTNDVQVIDQGVTVFPGQLIVNSGPDETIETVPAGDDELIPAHRVLTRFRDVELNIAEKRFWILYTTDDRTGIDLDKQVIRAGEQYDFAYVQDKDDDGVWAREEFLHGSSDLLVNSDGCDLDPAPEPCDTLTDNQEIKQGWRVQLRGSNQANLVYPNPVQGDSDRDTLPDDEELACAIDPRQRDTDLDGLTDWEEMYGKLLEGGDAEGNMVSRDPDTDEIVYTILPYDGDPGGGLFPHESIAACNDFRAALPEPPGAGFATDPLNDDTDGDLINDATELKLGINPNDSTDGAAFLDDDGDGVPNKTEQEGFFTTVNGQTVTSPFTSSPNNTDSDGDGLPDLLEHFIESNPLSADTDGDGISDFNEYKAGGQACVTQNTDEMCIPFSSLGENNFFTFVSACDAADVCSNAAIEQNLVDFGSQQYGTNLNEADSDDDGLDDLDEITGVSILVNGATLDVTSDPLADNSDSDLLEDGAERTAGTNPREADTDGDLTNDDAESALNRDPTVGDRRISVNYTQIGFNQTDCDYAADEEWEWELGYETPANLDLLATVPTVWDGGFNGDTDEDDETVTRDITGGPFSFIVELGDTFAITGKLEELDSGSVQDNFSWDNQYTITVGTAFGTTDASVTTGICGGNVDISINFVVD